MLRPSLLIAGVALALAAACSDDGSAGEPSDAATTSTAPFTCTPPPSGPLELTVGEEQRTFDVSLPPSFAEPAPVVLLFHGFTGTIEHFATVTGLAETGPASGIVVAALQGLGDPRVWRIIDGFDKDAAFVDAVLQQLTASSCIDPTRIWLAGFSMGSAFTGVYGCSRANDVAGLVMVSGLPPANCPEERSPRVLIAHGTADPLVHFDGGSQDVNGTTVQLPTIPESAAQWAERAGCTTGPADASVGSDVTISSWTDCSRGGPVDLLVVDGGGHAWPGAPRSDATAPTQTVSVSCLIRHLATDGATSVPTAAADCPGEG